jgi:4-amino-4-deoxy-L-arabinose transferase-like glycosyltransferase
MQSDDSGAVGAVAPGRSFVRLQRFGAAAVPLAIVGLAAALRFWKLNVAPDDPFYDAAVRSMSASWHNFFFGALEPGGSISVDKIPADLWLQVVSVKLFGFSRSALHLPEALGGTAAVALLYAAVRSVAGRLAAASAALFLAVLPISVLTSRSDTMDSLMVAVVVGALWASVRALQTRRVVWVMAAAVLIGVAFDVKLTEALIALPALAVLWWVALPPRRRIGLLGGAAAALVVVSVAWIVIASLTPAGNRPYPIGSHTGSIYRVVFVYNGVDRIFGKAPQLAPVLSRSTRGPLRLLRRPHPFYGDRVGLELVAALLLGVAALLARPERRRPPWRRGVEGQRGPPTTVAWWFGLSVALWLGIGVVLFSGIRDLLPRYVETISPAIAALGGLATAALLVDRRARASLLLAAALALTAAYTVYIRHSTADAVIGVAAMCVAIALLLAGAAGIARGTAPRRLAGVATVVGLLAAPLGVSINLIKHNATDAAQAGTGAQYSPYLRTHSVGTKYEAASSDVYGVTALVVHDVRPVLVLNDVHGIIVHLSTLQRVVRAGEVRYIVINHPCLSGIHCPATTIWSLQHSVRVQRGLYRYTPSSGAPA